MNNILAALANVATKDDSTMVITLKELTCTWQALKEKVDGIHEGKKERNKTIVNFIVGLMAESGTKITPALLATTRKKDIKMMQL